MTELFYFNASLFLGGIVSLGSGLLAFAGRNARESSDYAAIMSLMFLDLASAVWGFNYFLLITSGDADTAQIHNILLHIGAILIPILYLLFVLQLTNKFSIWHPMLVASIPACLFFLGTVWSGALFSSVIPKYIFSFAPEAGAFYGYFTIYFVSVAVGAGLLLLYEIVRSEGVTRDRFVLIFASSVAGFLGGGSVFFLTFNVYVPPYLLPLFSMYPLILTYGMVRFKLFDTKIIATEILVGTLVVFMIFRILISDTITQQIFDVVMVVFSSILGFFLIRSVRVEVETREKVESLAKMLEQKNAELAELNQRKTEFVSFANHQLRAPLQAINGYTSLLLDGDYGALTQKQNEALQKNLEAGQLMSLTIDDFLNIAKIELNKIEYQKEKRDIRELIDTVAREQRLATEKKGLTLTVKNAPQPLYANIDFNKLKQVISNLLDNSTKYTPTGGITMGVERVENLAKITLTDTGIGIPEGQVEKLFDKFSRASNANQGDNKGTGLGLYVAKQMIEAHQGTIQASSDGPGKGSTFTIRIPLVM